ncbi:MAG: YihY/virulence factor BrkB family protein, partial [Proteobacteria bacterium]|nr:YihY/virulence factor BrkB family protein [Pseudomonadota bacterium]
MATLDRLTWRNCGSLLLCAARYWSEDNASTIGAALAFFCAFSLAPLLVILLTIAGGVLGEQQAYGQVQAQMQELFGPATAKTVMDAVRASTQTNGLVS